MDIVRGKFVVHPIFSHCLNQKNIYTKEAIADVSELIKNLIFSLPLHLDQSTQYVCQTNQSSLQWTLYSSSHSAWDPSNSCALSFCNSICSNSSCRRSQTPCFEYVSYSNTIYCAPAALCSLMPSCNQTSNSCASNSGVCIWNSCCSSPVCLPLSWTSICTS